MIVAFDPVACEVIVEREDGLPPIDLHAATLEFRFYAHHGIYSLRLQSPGVLDVMFWPADDEPGIVRVAPSVQRIDDQHWLIRFAPIEDE